MTQSSLANFDDKIRGARRQAPRPKAGLTAALAALAVLAAMSVYLINGAGLYYFDTGSYLDQGRKMLLSLGALAETPVVGVEGVAVNASESTATAQDDNTVDTSRSAAYAFVLAALDGFGRLDLAVGVNFAALALAAYLVARQFARPVGAVPLRVAAWGVLAASLASLPFYVAFLMPDIFAPVLLLMLATLCVYGPDLSRWEFLLACGLAGLAIVSHPSHLLIGALFLPVGLLASPFLRGGRLLVFVVLALALVGVGVLERVAFKTAIERFGAQQANALPFLSARLIADGPGYAYLADHCPDAKIATCALAEKLDQSDDPMRLRGPNILFSTHPKTGSFKLLDADQRMAVSREQFRFVRDVFVSDPLAVIGSIIDNTTLQLIMARVDMTIPAPEHLTKLQTDYGPVVDDMRNGRIVLWDRAWLDKLVYVHAAVYLISGLALCGLMFSRTQSPKARRFAILVLVGILINAFVCGAVSVPAHRYGARVAWLVPMLAAMMLAVRKRPRKKPGAWRVSKWQDD